MRYPAVPPAVALVCGAALGLSFRAAPAGVAAALALGAALSVVGWKERVAPAFVAAALFTFAASGYALASTAFYRATHAPLRSALIAAGGPRAVSDAPGDPVTLIGTLEADASPSESGVRLSIDVARLVRDGREYRAAGGVLLTVAGDAPVASRRAMAAGTNREAARPAPAPVALSESRRTGR